MSNLELDIVAKLLDIVPTFPTLSYLKLAMEHQERFRKFCCLDMKTRLIFRVFPLSKLWIALSPKRLKQILVDL